MKRRYSLPRGYFLFFFSFLLTVILLSFIFCFSLKIKKGSHSIDRPGTGIPFLKAESTDRHLVEEPSPIGPGLGRSWAEASSTESLSKEATIAKRPSVVKDIIIVKFKPSLELTCIKMMARGKPSGIASIDRLIKRYRVKEMKKQFIGSKPAQDPNQPDLSRIYKVRFAPKFEPREVALAFSKDPYIEYAQTIGIHQTTFRKGIRQKE